MERTFKTIQEIVDDIGTSRVTINKRSKKFDIDLSKDDSDDLIHLSEEQYNKLIPNGIDKEDEKASSKLHERVQQLESELQQVETDKEHQIELLNQKISYLQERAQDAERRENEANAREQKAMDTMKDLTTQQQRLMDQQQKLSLLSSNLEDKLGIEDDVAAQIKQISAAIAEAQEQPKKGFLARLFGN